MDFESLKEQITETLSQYWDKIQDSDLYIKLKERYDTLPPNGQMAILWGAGLFVVYFFYSIPAGYVSDAQEQLIYFEDDRQMVRELIRAGRIERTVQTPPPAPGQVQLQSQLESKLTQERILPEQKTAMNPVDKVAPNSIVPKSIEQQGIKTTIQKINLRQVVKLGESLDGIDSTKLMNISIQADQDDPHYFNVDYELASFSVPQEKPLEDKDSKKKKKNKKRKKK